MAKPVQQPSWLELLGLIPGGFSLFLTAGGAVFTGLRRTEKDASTYYLHVAYAIMRKSTARFSPRQLQYVLPTSDQVYASYARSARGKTQIVQLPSGASGYWIGDSNAKNVIVWYHGGGFTMPLIPAFFQFWETLLAALRHRGKDFALFAPGYSLAPTATYPTQLIQAVDALRHVIEQRQGNASSVVMVGDSAGASLAMGVLLHLSHTHPAIAPLPLAKPLAGVALIGGPGTTSDKSWPAGVVQYSGGDIIDPDVVKVWMGLYFGGSKPDNYTDPLDAPQSWFENLKTQRMLLLAGRNELLLPLIELYAEKLKRSVPNLEYFVGEREPHIAPVYNLYAGDKQETKQGKMLASWLEELV